jgi:hypothetical protein
MGWVGQGLMRACGEVEVGPAGMNRLELLAQRAGVRRWIPAVALQICRETRRNDGTWIRRPESEVDGQ